LEFATGRQAAKSFYRLREKVTFASEKSGSGRLDGRRTGSLPLHVRSPSFSPRSGERGANPKCDSPAIRRTSVDTHSY
jgi:hypothetical protein